ncbi:pirin family protein [Waterburya agarophytonicola K14]|uniref:Pirin family protein n=1 Tax=Waterburya agarophytonicola KI4 TaxID=2874699 RepID=A0A964FEA9_9CYAN|nr:pirin family protein [Waterburya agarophytonicola]MCC0175662.1 pirin family protein [Waterburya agarophytonicola KI4]
MITIRPRNERGLADFGWLNSRHTFSFGSYYDPKHMGFASLRVINEDKVIPSQGFGTHGHQDMEIISYVLSGELAHKDSMGNGSVISSGNVQRMSAGTGVRHSEFNASDTNPVHFLQIWIEPDTKGLEPSYEEKNFTSEETQGKLRLVGSRDGRDGSVIIHQDVNLYLASLGKGDRLTHKISDNRVGWLQVTKGAVLLEDRLLQAGDGAGIMDEVEVKIEYGTDAGNDLETEILFFDLAK